ncbi:MAG: HesA/MoeB/ThiF family protein [Bacteroidota bacterium]
MKLSDNEKIRYNRHIILPEIGEDGQKKLKVAKVLVVGAGGLGSPVLTYLTAAGVGTIGIVEKDTVELSNLQRQILYSSSDIGKSKVDTAKERLVALNPEVKIITFETWLTEENAEKIIRDFDIVVDCPDNFSTRILVSDITKKLMIPHVYGSISKFEGHVAVFNYKNGPSYRDLFSEEPDDKIVDSDPSAKGVMGVLPGVIGTLQANETIKIITGLGEILSGKLLVFNTLNLSSYIVDIC